jgi:hypothetical protein
MSVCLTKLGHSDRCGSTGDDYCAEKRNKYRMKRLKKSVEFVSTLADSSRVERSSLEVTISREAREKVQVKFRNRGSRSRGPCCENACDFISSLFNGILSHFFLPSLLTIYLFLVTRKYTVSVRYSAEFCHRKFSKFRAEGFCHRWQNYFCHPPKVLPFTLERSLKRFHAQTSLHTFT